MKKLIVLLLLVPCLGLSQNIENYVCESDYDSTSPLKESSPKLIQISFDHENNKLLDFAWDGTSVLNHFEAIDFSSQSKLMEIWTKKFPLNLDKTNIEKGIYFELYSEDLVGHLYKQFVSGLDYQCKEI
jgi:hypothetical protein|tara:strand:- start:811 stop:1197 length:387 start_codon:yes stop_codon:yes gene_type:complete